MSLFYWFVSTKKMMWHSNKFYFDIEEMKLPYKQLLSWVLGATKNCLQLLYLSLPMFKKFKITIIEYKLNTFKLPINQPTKKFSK
jgi:hypothetical protein